MSSLAPRTHNRNEMRTQFRNPIANSTPSPFQVLSRKRTRPCENSGLNGRRVDQKTVRLLNKHGYICCMQHIQGGDRNQTLLLPAAVDDYVGRENPVRFIEAF